MHLWYFHIFPDAAVDDISFRIYDTIDGRIAGNRRPYTDVFQRFINLPVCMNDAKHTLKFVVET